MPALDRVGLDFREKNYTICNNFYNTMNENYWMNIILCHCRVDVYLIFVENL